MSDFFIFAISIILNCLFVYLASGFIVRVLNAGATNHVMKIARMILALAVWAGSAIFFTYGATALINLDNPTQGSTAYGDWRDWIGIINGVLPVFVMMFVVKKSEASERLSGDVRAR